MQIQQLKELEVELISVVERLQESEKKSRYRSLITTHLEIVLSFLARAIIEEE